MSWEMTRGCPPTQLGRISALGVSSSIVASHLSSKTFVGCFRPASTNMLDKKVVHSYLKDILNAPNTPYIHTYKPQKAYWVDTSAHPPFTPTKAIFHINTKLLAKLPTLL
jgi:hypothetical protein